MLLKKDNIERLYCEPLCRSMPGFACCGQKRESHSAILLAPEVPALQPVPALRLLPAHTHNR